MILRLGSDGEVALADERGPWTVASPESPLPRWAQLVPGRPAVMISRTPDTCTDLYHMMWDGAWYACEELRPLVSMLPPSARTIPEATRAYLRAFRTLPYAHHIVGPIRRAHMFEQVSCTVGAAGFAIGIHVEAMRVEPTVESLEDACDLVAGALRAESRRQIPRSGARLLLSGGVDSTLLAALVRDHPVRFAVTVPSFAEYANETAYAQEAARLLGVPLELVPADAGDLEALLTEAVQRSLQPPNHTQTVLLYAAFRSEPGAYLTAQFADALFGFGRSTTGYAARRLATLLAPLSLLPVRSMLPGKLRSALRVHDALQRDPGNSESWTATYARYLSAAGAERLVGASMLSQLSEERARLARATYPGAAPSSVDAPMALGQWLDYVHDDAIAIWSAMARGVGSSLVAPHHSCCLVEATHEIAMPLRVTDGSRAKPVLRALLGRLLPAYDLQKQKLASGLPMVRMVREGYPTLFADAERTELAGYTKSVSEHHEDWAEAAWSVLSARLWESAIARAPHVATAPAAIPATFA